MGSSRTASAPRSTDINHWYHQARDAAYDPLRAHIKAVERLAVPTLMIQGLADGTVLAKSTEGKDDCFTAGYRRLTLEGVGHFPTREAPEAVADALIEHFRANARR